MVTTNRKGEKDVDLHPEDVARWRTALRTGWLSRYASEMGRLEVLSGRAKFGIFGDGKELPQLALATALRPGDWRSGYYRDQTLMLAMGSLSLAQFFAQLYGDPDPEREPHSAGRQMNAHFATPLFDTQFGWLPQRTTFQSAADLSPTAAQMARSLGLALASKLYRSPLVERDHAPQHELFSNHGEEICVCTIGNASTSEGVFWETINAATVMQVPLVVCVWDDGYGISVPNEVHTATGSISQALRGMSCGEPPCLDVRKVDGRDYFALETCFREVVHQARTQHRPALVHVTDLTQPLGHSSSGSHERYKSAERLAWEAASDGLKLFGAALAERGIADEPLQKQIQEESRRTVEWSAREAFATLTRARTREIYDIQQQIAQSDFACEFPRTLETHPHLRSFVRTLRQELTRWCYLNDTAPPAPVATFLTTFARRYTDHLWAPAPQAPLQTAKVLPDADQVEARILIRDFFDAALSERPNLLIFGEDVQRLGGVNLEFEGLAARHGATRVCDTSVREATIVGQAVGLALRGWRPVADIQYLDYLIYGLQGISDDLASLHYRTAGRQRAPVILRTKGHRLEGIWHTGSPLGMILSSCPGLIVAVPRNATQAAGLYQALLDQDNPALVIEVLSGLRRKEPRPETFGYLPPGYSACLRPGSDLSLVTYGACVRVAEEAAATLALTYGIEVELIDVQTLAPFDLDGAVLSSLIKTRRLLICDEDVPGGASAYLLEKLLVAGGGHSFLDAPPQVVCASANRSPYGDDGDYVCKPNPEDLVEAALEVMTGTRVGHQLGNRGASPRSCTRPPRTP